MTIIHYARGAQITSADVQNQTAPSFKAFADMLYSSRVPRPEKLIYSDTGKILNKGDAYICAAMKKNRRKAANALSRAYLVLDCDGFAIADVFHVFKDYLKKYQCSLHTTFQHTEEEPRLRAFIALNKEVDRETLITLSIAFQARIVADLGADLIKFDQGANNIELPMFLPLTDCEFHYFDGEPLKVEDYLPPMPENPKVRTKNAAKKGEIPNPTLNSQDDNELDRAIMLNQVSPQTFIDLQSAVQVLPADDYNDWLAVAMALAFFKGTEYEEKALFLLHEYSEKSAKYDAEQVSEKWETLTLPDSTSYKAIFAKAQGRGWVNPMAKMLTTEEDPQKMKINQLSELFLTQIGGKDNLRVEVGNYVVRYNGKYWERITDEVIVRQVRAFMDNICVGYNDNKVRSILNTLKIQLDLLGDENSDFIAFNNGVVNRNTGEFLSHQKNHFLVSCSPHDYSENQTETPVFSEWVDFVANGDPEKSAVIRAALYMILTNRWNWQLFIELVGVGGSGKSVFTELAAVLVGRKNVVSKCLEELDRSRDRDSLDSARLITIPDQQRYHGQGAGLKGITGGDLLRIDPKNKQPYSTYIKAVVLMSHNGTVNFTERNNGIERRRVLIYFNQEVPNDKKDYSFSQKLEMECGGIISQLLSEFSDPFSARRILENQRNSKEALILKQESDHTMAFAAHFETLSDCSGLRVGTRRNVDDMNFFYPMYLRYCDAYGHMYPVSVVKFKEAMQTAFKAQGEKYPYQVHKYTVGYKTNVRLKTDNTLDFSWLSAYDFSV